MDQISPAVWIGFVLSVLSTLLCVVYGLARWNRTGGPDEPVEEIVQWAKDEEDVEAKLN